MRRVLASLLSALLALCSLTSATDTTGLEVFLTNNGLQYLATVGVEVLEQQLGDLPIPPINGSTKVAIVGTIHYYLTEIKLESYDIGDYTVAFENGVTLDTTSVSMTMSLDWKYDEKSWPHAKGHGSAKITISDTTVSATISAVEQDGLPHVNKPSVSVDIGKLKVKIYDGASWLSDLFEDLFNGLIKKSLEKALDEQVPTLIENGINQQLNTLPTKQKLNHWIGVDYSLVDSPVFESDYMRLDDYGSFYDATGVHTDAPPFVPAAMPSTPPDEDYDVGIYVAETVADAAAYVFYENDRLTITFTADQVPASSPITLDTTAFVLLVPELVETYGAGVPMYVTVVADSSPVLVLNTTGAFGIGEVFLDVGVSLSNGTSELAFTLLASVTAQADVTLGTDHLGGSILGYNATYSLYSSNIGNFSVTPINFAADLVVGAVLPLLNNITQAGIPIPVVQGVELSGVKLKYLDQYVGLAASATYTEAKLLEFLDGDEDRVARIQRRTRKQRESRGIDIHRSRRRSRIAGVSRVDSDEQVTNQAWLHAQRQMRYLPEEVRGKHGAAGEHRREEASDSRVRIV